MRRILGALIATAGVVGLAVTAQAAEGCGGMYTTSLDVATGEGAPISTPADGTTAATDTATKPVLTDQGGG